MSCRFHSQEHLLNRHLDHFSSVKQGAEVPNKSCSILAPQTEPQTLPPMLQFGKPLSPHYSLERTRSVGLSSDETQSDIVGHSQPPSLCRSSSALDTADRRPISQISVAASARSSIACVDDEALSRRISRCLRYGMIPSSTDLIASLGLAGSNDKPPGVEAAIHAAKRGEYSTSDIDPDLVPSCLSTPKSGRLSGRSACGDMKDDIDLCSCAAHNVMEATLNEPSSANRKLTCSLHSPIANSAWRSRQFDVMVQSLNEPYLKQGFQEKAMHNNQRGRPSRAATISHSIGESRLPKHAPLDYPSDAHGLLPLPGMVPQTHICPKVNDNHLKMTIDLEISTSDLPSDRYERPAYAFLRRTDHNVHSQNPSNQPYSTFPDEEATLRRTGSPPLQSPLKTPLTPEWVEAQRSRHPLGPSDVHPAYKSLPRSPLRQNSGNAFASGSRPPIDSVNHHNVKLSGSIPGPRFSNYPEDSAKNNPREQSTAPDLKLRQSHSSSQSSKMTRKGSNEDKGPVLLRSSSSAVNGDINEKRKLFRIRRPKSVMIEQDKTYERAQNLLFAQRPASKSVGSRQPMARAPPSEEPKQVTSPKVARFFGEDPTKSTNGDSDTYSKEHDRIARQSTGSNKKRMSAVGEDVKKQLKRLLG